MKLKIFILLTLILSTKLVIAQDEWTFKTESNGIKVYSNTKSILKVKPIKVECAFNATPAQITAVLLDIKNYPDWMYKNKLTTLIKQVSSTELYYYAELNMPWPAQDRDFAAQITAIENPEKKSVTVEVSSVTGLVPEKAGITRVRKSNGKWIITPMSNNQVNVTYYLQIEPDGAAPAWLINMMVSDGPMQSFKKLKLQLQKPAYKNAVSPFK
ncbi:MAG: lipid-binding protein [Mucilaginibacter sp.]|nr:lipid-binding protein [Mucilaginibacter sp.]